MAKAIKKKSFTIPHKVLEALRFTAIRMIKKGIRVEVIAESMKLSRSTVFGWFHKFRKLGWKALESTKAPGARPKLSQDQILQLLEMLKKPATAYEFASDLWTGPRVKKLIKKIFGVDFYGEHMPRFLRRLGLVQKNPERRALEQNQKKVRRWIRYELPRIKKWVQAAKGLLLYADEAFFYLIPHVGKTWTFPEIRPIARVSGKRGIKVGVTSAVSSRGHLVFQLAKKKFNAASFIRFLGALHRHFPRKKLFVVIDGARPHTANRVRKEFTENNKEWLSLHYLPAYSPELNPSEEVWNFSKTKKLSARQTADEKQLRSAVVGSLRSLQKRPHLVKKFFDK
jgi:transposase